MTSPREEPKEKPETSKPARSREMEEADVATGKVKQPTRPTTPPASTVFDHRPLRACVHAHRDPWARMVDQGVIADGHARHSARQRMGAATQGPVVSDLPALHTTIGDQGGTIDHGRDWRGCHRSRFGRDHRRTASHHLVT